jgi:LPXTG-motif cell wall-anchored protein
MSPFWEPTMKKLTSLGALALGALIALLALLGFSGPAQAYPEVSIDLTVNRQVLYGGENFTATASSKNTVCAWTLEWDGVVRTGSSSGNATTDNPFKTTYTADEVSKITKIPLNGTCSYSGTSARGASTWHRTIIITVLPRSSAVSPPGSSDLPNTGGPNLLFLAGGILLLASGAIAVTVARRRAEEAELQAFRA